MKIDEAYQIGAITKDENGNVVVTITIIDGDVIDQNTDNRKQIAETLQALWIYGLAYEH